MVLIDNGGRRAGEVTLLAPPADLANTVEHVWIDDARHAAGTTWRVVADASPYLVATVTVGHGERTMRVAAIGARSTAATIDVGDRALTVGVRLRPGALPVLTNASARELVDRSTTIGDVVRGDVLRDLELSADAPPSLVARELMRVIRRAGDRHTPRWSMPGDLSGPAPVGRLAVSTGTTTRALLDRAYQHVGLSPMRMLRITRLHEALHVARSGTASWAEIADRAGYADQAHFCREVRALLGETPSAWVARGSADSFKTARHSLD